MGKAEGTGENWHGHVTAVTVAPEYRRLGLANKMMLMLEEISEKVYVRRCLFYDTYRYAIYQIRWLFCRFICSYIKQCCDQYVQIIWVFCVQASHWLLFW